MKVLGIIPARLESSRIKRKPLFKLKGVECLLHVYYRAIKNTTITDIIIATDSREIYEIARAKGAKVMMTSVNHLNPTERMVEVKKKYNDYDLYVLINGDEALLQPIDINISINTLLNDKHAIASMLLTKYSIKNSYSDFKIVTDVNKHILYISRSDIPMRKDGKANEFLKAYHLMTFRPEALEIYDSLDPTPLELIVQHEHLRFVENGYKIITEIVDQNCVSLDEMSDVPIIENLLESDELFNDYKDL